MTENNEKKNIVTMYNLNHCIVCSSLQHEGKNKSIRSNESSHFIRFIGLHDNSEEPKTPRSIGREFIIRAFVDADFAGDWWLFSVPGLQHRLLGTKRNYNE